MCLLALISCAFWGSAFPCIKLGYDLFEVNTQHIPSVILFAGMRFSLAGIIAITIGSIASRKFLVPRKLSTLKHVIMLSFLQTMIQYFFFYVGLAHTTGVKASIIGGANAFVALLISAFLFHHETMTRRKLIGCILGFTGVVLVNLNQGGLGGGFHFFGEGFVFLSTISSAMSANCLKAFGKDDHPVLLSGWQFFIGGVNMILCGLLFGGQVSVPPPEGFFLLFHLGCISAVAYSIWGILLKHNPVSRVTVFGFMTPVFGVLLSAILLQEMDQAMGPAVAIALILVCIGIYTVNSSGKKQALSSSEGGKS